MTEYGQLLYQYGTAETAADDEYIVQIIEKSGSIGGTRC